MKILIQRSDKKTSNDKKTTNLQQHEYLETIHLARSYINGEHDNEYDGPIIDIQSILDE